ncbi:MAG: AI-2E family transporter [Lentimicrobium sp.]|jgi:predicted PurR-regulated permease PerM|nr:AI-2E family transporter [Lentimicrobium sp.]MDD4598001.1 AI-2E family transporter [Lentimicrobiaceae bacterium]MDY0025192.1 AI-2E family transporter [Lentimicrobium sp.]
MNKTLKTILTTAGILLLLLFLWYFSNIVFYILAAAVISVVGRPLVHMFDSLRLRRFRVPHALSALLTLLIMLSLFLAFVMLLIPLVAQQAKAIAQIDTTSLSNMLEFPMGKINQFLHETGYLDPGQGISDILVLRLKSILSMNTFAIAINQIVSFMGSMFMGLFSILFISFFFLKDDRLFFDGFILLVPEKYIPSATRVLKEVKHLLTRYFVGISIEVTSMITLLTIGLSLFGVENALLIGFIGGLFNIIPYLGPIIGGSIGILIGIIGSLSLGVYGDILPISLTIAGVFAVSNLIDNILLQPIIYSTSVRAHPIEIFLVIIMGGSVFGVVGMILAVPSYTVFRVFLREFFSEMRVVKRLTENM